MALVVKTKNPTRLLSSIKKAIDDNNVRTWSYDSENDFTHSNTQWDKQAYLRAEIDTQNEILRFRFVKPHKDAVIEQSTRGIYQGRFIEMLITHFSKLFSSASAVA